MGPQVARVVSRPRDCVPYRPRVRRPTVRCFRSAIPGDKPRIWAMLFSDPWFLFVFLPAVLAGGRFVGPPPGPRAGAGVPGPAPGLLFRRVGPHLPPPPR